MHSAVLSATGYALLLSSVVTLLVLLWLRCRRQRRKKSPFYILTTSDVLSTALTAVVLLLNQMETGVKMDYNWQSDIGDRSNNYTWTIENQQQVFPFLQRHDLREAADNLNVTLTCDMKDVLMQYGMLLAALANAFVSLLTLVAQCNLSAACVKQRYNTSRVESLGNDARPDSRATAATNRERRTTNDQAESTSHKQDDNVNATDKSRNGIQRFVQRIGEISRCPVLKEDDERPAGYLVMTHWLVPLLVVGILYFAEYDDTNVTRRTEDTECTFKSNFPMTDFFHVFSEAGGNLKTANSPVHVTLKNNHIILDKELNKLKPSNVEVDQVVSRVQDIVRVVLGSAANSTENVEMNFRDNSGAGNATKHIAANDTIACMENDTNNDAATRILHGTSMDRNATSEGEEEEEEDVITSESLNNEPEASTQSKNTHEEAVQIYPTSTEGNIRNVTHVFNTHQIYTDILKRIQGAGVHNGAGKIRYNPREDRSEPERHGSRSYTAKGKLHSSEHLSASETDRFSRINSVTSGDPQENFHYMNKCLLSMRFLKLHLLALSFAIYFLPILLSCILHVRGRHTCRNALAMLEANVDLASVLFHSNVNSNTKRINAIHVDKPSANLWLSEDNKKVHQRSSESDMPGERNSVQNRSNDSDIEAISEREESREKTQARNTLEIDCMMRIFDTVRLSLILCVILWTPVFLETLLRSFSCTEAPRWWNNVTLSSAISFGIVRNALNVNIIKIQEVCSADAKNNRVRPIK